MKRNNKHTSHERNAIVILNDLETWSGIQDTKIAVLDPHFKMEGLKVSDFDDDGPMLADGSLPKDHIEEVICINYLLDFYLNNRGRFDH